MANVSTVNANTFIDMSDPLLVDFQSGLVATSSNFSWLSFPDEGPFPVNDVDIHGKGFTYTGLGNGRELASGTIAKVSLDPGNDNGSETAGDFVISGFAAAPIVTNIDKDSPRTFWNELLKGDDTFDLSGLSEGQVGQDRSTIFGDDLSSATSFPGGGTTDQGGNDVITASDNLFDIFGDVYTVQGGRGRFAVYDAGDDTLSSAATDSFVWLIGDAWRLGANGTLLAGDDVVDNHGNIGTFSHAIGDLLGQTGGTFHGGNDTVTADNGFNANAFGDIHTFAGEEGVAHCGDDVLTTRRDATLIGDVALVTALSGTIECGDDHLTGSRLDDSIVGDVGDHSNGAFTILVTGGNDTMLGGRGNDTIVGELDYNPVMLADYTGGDDLIDGGIGNDTLSGQLGDDTIQGGAGNDTIGGGNGIDVATYADASAGVTVNLALTTVQNTGGAGSDKIANVEDLTGSAFSDVLSGSALANALKGGAGSDLIRSSAGDDTLNGGAGTDTADFLLEVASVSANLQAGTATGSTIGSDLLIGIERAAGGSADDALTGSSVANLLNGNGGDDVLKGLGGDDTLLGRDGADSLSGYAGSDALNGGNGSDSLAGNKGDDSLAGGNGNDTLTGGADRDTFILAPGGGNDRVLGFFDANDPGDAEEDTIDVSGFGFSSVADIATSSLGDDAILTLAPGQSVRLVDYLATHALADLAAEDFIL